MTGARCRRGPRGRPARGGPRRARTTAVGGRPAAARARRRRPRGPRASAARAPGRGRRRPRREALSAMVRDRSARWPESGRARTRSGAACLVGPRAAPQRVGEVAPPPVRSTTTTSVGVQRLRQQGREGVAIPEGRAGSRGPGRPGRPAGRSGRRCRWTRGSQRHAGAERGGAQTARFFSLRRSRSERPPRCRSARRWRGRTRGTRPGPRTPRRPSWPRGWTRPSRGRTPRGRSARTVNAPATRGSLVLDHYVD